MSEVGGGGGGGGGGSSGNKKPVYVLLGSKLVDVAASFHCRRGFQCIVPPVV